MNDISLSEFQGISLIFKKYGAYLSKCHLVEQGYELRKAIFLECGSEALYVGVEWDAEHAAEEAGVDVWFDRVSDTSRVS